MTVIAWDGKTLAADRESSDQYMKTGACVKIARIRGHLVGAAGSAAHIMEMRAWFAAGAVPADFPRGLREDRNAVTMMVITPERRVDVYQGTPHPFTNIGACHAIGGGREAAMAVMLMGGKARRAVEIASVVCAGCGNGIDTLKLE